MDSKLKKVSIFSAVLILVVISAFIFGYEGYRNLLGIKESHHSLKKQNSIKGLELIEQINSFKRLTKNDLKLIEHIARRELGMVREGEIVFVYEPARAAAANENKKPGFSPGFRYVTEDEFEKLLKFDLKSFDFYEELSEFEKQVHPGGFNLND